MSRVARERFRQRRVLVTGAATGIGLAIARAFLAEGARVALADVRSAALEALEVDPGRTLLLDMDVRDSTSVRAGVEALRSRWGGVDVLVSNAGIYPNSTVLEMPEAEWDRVLDTNLKGAFLVCQAVARDMVRRGEGGKIVTITSGAQDSTRVGSGHYATSKAGLMMFTRTLALELAPHRINVNAVAPGFTTVPGEVSPLSDDYVAAITRTIPWGRAAEPEEIAPAVLFMASDDAEFVTGTVLKVDGGRGAGHFALPRSRPDATS